MLRSRMDRFAFRVIAGIVIVAVLGLGIPAGYIYYREGRERSLVDAVRSNNALRVESLLNSGVSPNAQEVTPPPVQSLPPMRTSVLNIALATSHPEIAETLVKRGAKPDLNTLVLSAKQENSQVALDLIEKGADRLHTVQFALETKNIALANEIIKRYPDTVQKVKDSKWLGRAAQAGNVEMLATLLDWGEDIEETDSVGNTPLMAAAMTGTEGAIQLLIKRGAKVNATNNLGRDALFYANLARHENAAEALVNRGGRGRAVRLNPVQKAALMVQQGLVAEALVFVRRILAKNPKDEAARIELGYILEKQGQINDATAEYRKVVALNPNNAQGHGSLAWVLWRSAHLDEAITHYRVAVHIDPLNYERHRVLGYALEHYPAPLGVTPEVHAKFVDGVAEYSRCVELQPKNPSARYLYATALANVGRYQECIEQIKQGLTIKNRDGLLHSAYGDALILTHSVEEGLKEKRLATSLEPNNARLIDSLANALFEQKRLAEAISEEKRAIRVNPNYGPAIVSLGWFLMEAGRLDEALNICQRAAQLLPGNDNALANYGKALSMKGNYPEAIRICRGVVKYFPLNAEARYYLVEALVKSGDKASAKAELQKYLQMPKNVEQEKERIQSANQIWKQL